MTARLTGISVSGFKSLGRVELELDDLTVLIGDNGSGKSSILEVLEILRGTTDQHTNSIPVGVMSSLAEAVGGVDWFGTSVALSEDGDTLAVSAFFEDSSATGIDGDQANGGAANSGAVYVFVRNGVGAWSQQAYIKASNRGRQRHRHRGWSSQQLGRQLGRGVPLLN